MFCLQSVLGFGAVARETRTESGITNRVTITTALLLHGVAPPQPKKNKQQNCPFFFLAQPTIFFCMTHFFNYDLKNKG